MNKITLQLDSHIGVEDFMGYKKTFQVKNLDDTKVVNYLKDLHKVLKHFNYKWSLDDIEDSLYIVYKVNNEDSEELESLLEKYLED